LREIVASKLIQEWSPEQISGWLKTEYPKDERMRVSHETIYQLAPLGSQVVHQLFFSTPRAWMNRLGKDPLKLRTVLSLVIGKAIC
jgi:IS30 family transposase